MNGDIRPPKRKNDTPTEALKKAVNDHLLRANNPMPTNQELAGMKPIDTNKPQTNVDKRRRTVLIIAGIVAVIILSIIAGTIWYNKELAAVTPGMDEKVKVTIKPGSSPIDIGKQLYENDLIRSQAAFAVYARITGKSGSLQSGSYRLSKAEDVPAIIRHLTSGLTDTFSITFLPGATLAQDRKVLLNAGFSVQAVDAALNKQYGGSLFDGKPAGTDLEGYIYGETYDFPAEATPEQIVKRALDQFQTVVQKENLAQQYKNRGFTLYQGITLASIIQREVVSAADSAQVAQVFELRLSRSMPLGSDVTYQYIADKTGQARSPDLDSPYNTRRYAGLPPGPISAPGLAALRAVGNPARGDYLFFISGDDDKTYFARTNEEHVKNVQQHCQKKCQIT